MMNGIIEWGTWALVAHLVIGTLLAAVILLPVTVHSGPPRMSWKYGLLTGLTAAIWMHFFLFLQLPVALASIPLLGHLPMGLSFLLLGSFGIGLVYWMLRTAKHYRWLRGLVMIGLIGALQFIPHDVFRVLAPQRDSLPRDTPRVMIVSIDALRQDVLEKDLPEFKAPQGVQPVVAMPATRLAWNLLLGGEPKDFQYGLLVPTLAELQHPEKFKLLRLATEKGLRTAFAINDSLTPTFFLQPTLFTTVLEPQGGWKYYFTIGYATTWPIYSWVQNFVSPIETNNPWSSQDAYWRDIGRLLDGHHIVATHNCALHPPLNLTFRELQQFLPWTWLAKPAYKFQSYYGAAEINSDHGSRLGKLSDSSLQYQVRVHSVLRGLPARFKAWTAQYPELSGVLTADHGESFPPIQYQAGEVAGHLNGVHGFTQDPDTVRVPLGLFGDSRPEFKPGDVFSWFDLRDALQAWCLNPGPLRLSGSPTGWLLQSPYISGMGADHSNSAQSSSLTTESIARVMYLHPSGLWYASDMDFAKLQQKMELASSLVYPDGHIDIFLPTSKETWTKASYRGYTLERYEALPKEKALEQIAAFGGRRPIPMSPPSASVH
jgi:hypothetical protein